jgi:hypothetical protein
MSKKDFRQPHFGVPNRVLCQQQLDCTMATKSHLPFPIFLVRHRFPQRYSNPQWATSGGLRSLIFRKLHLSHPDRIE